MKRKYDLQRKADGLIKRVATRFGIHLNPGDYVSVSCSKENQAYYSPELNHSQVRQEDRDDGDIIGEEIIGHPLRSILMQYAAQRQLSGEKNSFAGKLKAILGKHYPEKADFKDDDSDVSEFFGYIGRKMLEEVARPGDNLKFKKRKSINVPESYKQHHDAGYQYAAQIDLSKITDFQKFFELPAEEVRARFFRKDPQYDFTAPKSLESVLRVISPVILISSIFLVSSKIITGNMILNANSQYNFSNSIPLVVILLVSLVFVVMSGIRKPKSFLNLE